MCFGFGDSGFEVWKRHVIVVKDQAYYSLYLFFYPSVASKKKNPLAPWAHNEDRFIKCY